MSVNTSVEEVLVYIREHAGMLGGVELPLDQVQAGTLQQELRADRDVPAVSQATCRGYAIYADRPRQGGETLRIQASVPPGVAPPVLRAEDQAIEVQEGSVLATGCDTVVSAEEVQWLSDTIVLPDDPAAIEVGSNVKARGSESKKGEIVLTPGTRLHAPQIAIAASVGAEQLRVNTPPRVVLITTGDGLVSAEREPLPHETRQTLPAALEALVLSWGRIFWDHYHVDDRSEELSGVLEYAMQEGDIVLISGAVSQAKWSMLPDVLQRAGIDSKFQQTAQKPGKPMWFGCTDRQMVFGLPGNPLGAMCCVRRYIWTALDVMSGAPARIHAACPLTEPLNRDPEHTIFVPVRQEEIGVRPIQLQPSVPLYQIGGTDGFIECPRGQGVIPRGTPLPFFSWS